MADDKQKDLSLQPEGVDHYEEQAPSKSSLGSDNQSTVTSSTIKKRVEIDLDLEVDTQTVGTDANPYRKMVQLARAVDAWRIFPRVFFTAYIYVFYEMSMWIMALPNPTTQQTSLYSVITGVGAAWFGLYVGSSKFKGTYKGDD